MPLVSLSGVSVSFGERKLFEGVNLTVAAGSRLALVGPNGSGKTTLMRIMAGWSQPDSGTVVREKETRVSYVPQSGVVHAGATLRDEAEKAFATGAALVAEIRALEERLGALSPESTEADALLWKHHELGEKLEKSGYNERKSRIDRVLTGLGFSRADFDKEASSFSAGWQMRIALARALLESPDILLLDEPTNYLDIEARTWLEGFLAQYDGGLLLVSHDRYFLDVVVTAVAEIYMAGVSVFNGNYSHYEEVRQRELDAVMARWQAQQEEIARVEVFINKFRYKATKARQVQSRITMLEKMERVEIPPVSKTIHFTFPPPPSSGRIVLSAADLVKSYGDNRVFGGVGFEVSKGDKLVVVGVNGAGKSTLLRLIAGRETPDNGTMKWGTGVVPAFYSQENADAWSSERQVVEEVEAVAPTPLIPQVRTLLGAFLFRGDDVFKSVSVLSGGEKSRLAMLLLLLRPANLLILDEPTNHLDIASKDVLLSALNAFTGTVIFVSHDRHFISHLATAVLEVKGGGARYFPGDYDYYLDRVAREEAGEAMATAAKGAASAGGAGARSAAEPAPVSATQRERQEDKRKKSELRSLEREETRLMETLESLESERKTIEETMASPEAYANGEKMRELSRRHDENAEKHAKAMEEWETVDGKISALRESLGAPRV
ncbi:MAG TPA: ABC-F family ATP-binding cassette domain-containing protein [Spirochaetia bacterium]